MSLNTAVEHLMLEQPNDFLIKLCCILITPVCYSPAMPNYPANHNNNF